MDRVKCAIQLVRQLLRILRRQKKEDEDFCPVWSRGETMLKAGPDTGSVPRFQ